MEENEKDLTVLESRKVKALEKIASSLDAVALWLEEIDKEDWDKRLQFYLGEFHKIGLGSHPSWDKKKPDVDEKKKP